MRKSQIIATCLANSGAPGTQQEIEHTVQQVFRDKYPNENYAAWNSDVADSAAQKIISTVGRSSTIRVEHFIQDLWKAR